MKFQLRTTDYIYCQKDMMRLQELGFTFEPYQTSDKWSAEHLYPAEKSPYFKKTNSPTVDIPTLDDLVNLASEFGELIVGKDFVEIYDDYR